MQHAAAHICKQQGWHVTLIAYIPQAGGADRGGDFRPGGFASTLAETCMQLLAALAKVPQILGSCTDAPCRSVTHFLVQGRGGYSTCNMAIR